VSFIGTQQDPLGKDRLGRKEMNTPLNAKLGNDSDSNTFKGGSPLALAEYYKIKDQMKKFTEKKLIFEGNEELGLLDEKQLKDI
jgi:hypothetical protein